MEKIFNSFHKLRTDSQEQYNKLSNNQKIHFQSSCFLFTIVVKTVGSIPCSQRNYSLQNLVITVKF